MCEKGVRGNGSHLEKEICLLPHISHHFHLLSTFRVRFGWGKLLWLPRWKVEQLCKCLFHPIQPVRDSCEGVCWGGNFISMLSVTKWMMKKVWHMRGKEAHGGWSTSSGNGILQKLFRSKVSSSVWIRIRRRRRRRRSRDMRCHVKMSFPPSFYSLWINIPERTR